MSDSKIKRIYREISQLPYKEKTILLSKLMSEIAVNINDEQKSNFYNIKGIGKEIWEGIDAQEYVSKERASWE